MIHHLIRGPYHSLRTLALCVVAALVLALAVSALLVSLQVNAGLRRDLEAVTQRVETLNMRVMHNGQIMGYHGIGTEAVDMPVPRCGECHGEGE